MAKLCTGGKNLSFVERLVCEIFKGDDIRATDKKRLLVLAHASIDAPPRTTTYDSPFISSKVLGTTNKKQCLGNVRGSTK